MSAKLITYISQNYAGTLGTSLAYCYVENHKTADKNVCPYLLRSQEDSLESVKMLGTNLSKGRDDAKRPELHTCL